MKNIFIQSRPGRGKTTLIMRIIASLTHKTAGGFYTKEIRALRGRVGFRAVTLDGREGILAHVNLIESEQRVGKYRVDRQVIDNLIVDSLLEAIKQKDIVIIDEIGKMEMLSREFQSAARKALDSPKKVLATIPEYTNSFLASLRARSDVEIFFLDVDNRDELVEKIRVLLKS
jgi:nucleoside-triphosphatase